MITFKQFFSISVAFLCFCCLDDAQAQQWNGANDPNGSIWRPGNVWIGVDNSNRPFHVRGENMIFQIDRDRQDPGFGITRYSRGFNQVWKSFTFYVEGTAEDKGKFIIADWHQKTSGPSDARFVIDNVGNVGIGTEIPSERLHVNGLLRAGNLVMGRYTLGLGLFPNQNGVFLRNPEASPNGNFIQQTNSGQLSITAHNEQAIIFGEANPGGFETTMRLYDNGHLGLGTSGLAREKLDVRGNIYLPNHAIISAGGSRLNFGTAGFGDEDDDIVLAIADDGEFVVRANDSRAFRVNNPTGNNGQVRFDYNVGIGIQADEPAVPLHVRGSILAFGGDMLLRQRNNGENDGMGLEHINPTTLGVKADGFIHFRESDNNTTQVFFDLNSGRVGIGTTNPTSRLTVNGGILTEEIRVISNVPSSDYVFEENYDLRSLKEVEAFVKKHKHLPEIPSAREFKEDGYKLGDMDDLLLRKVEELTLYIIKQDKQIKSLQRAIKKLKSQAKK